MKNINSKIIDVAGTKIDKIYRYFLSKNISYDLLKDLDLENIIEINKNKEGEILNVDFDLDRAYEILDIITNELTIDLNEIEQDTYPTFKDLDVRDNGIILEVPLFLASNYAFLSNLGPKIYLKVNLISTLLTNLQTKITNYGLNNALVELYVTIELDHELLSPVLKSKQNLQYDVLISSKIINGRVPEIYGDVLTKNSNLISEEN